MVCTRPHIVFAVSVLGRYMSNPGVYSDNQSAIRLSRNPIFHDRTRHADVKFNFIRDIT